MGDIIPDITRLFQSSSQSKLLIKKYNELTPSSSGDNFEDENIVKEAKMFAIDYNAIESEIEHFKSEAGYWLERNIELPLSDCGFDTYVKGFKEGYFTFEKEVLHPDISVTETINIGLIFDFVNTKLHKSPISLLFNGNYDNQSEIRMYNNGKERGQLYRAWVIILSNPICFEPMFKPKVAPDIPKRRIKPFSNYLKTDNPDNLAEKIKTKFNLNKGKETAMLINCLSEAGCLKNDIIKTDFYKAMAEYLGKSIGTDPSLDRYLGTNFSNRRINPKDFKYQQIKSKVQEILNPE